MGHRRRFLRSRKEHGLRYYIVFWIDLLGGLFFDLLHWFMAYQWHDFDDLHVLVMPLF